MVEITADLLGPENLNKFLFVYTKCEESDKLKTKFNDMKDAFK